MSITEIAVITSLVFMGGFAIAAVIGRSGYAFDLRRKASRRRDPNRTGGRRTEDLAAA